MVPRQGPEQCLRSRLADPPCSRPPPAPCPGKLSSLCALDRAGLPVTIAHPPYRGRAAEPGPPVARPLGKGQKGLGAGCPGLRGGESCSTSLWSSLCGLSLLDYGLPDAPLAGRFEGCSKMRSHSWSSRCSRTQKSEQKPPSYGRGMGWRWEGWGQRAGAGPSPGPGSSLQVHGPVPPLTTEGTWTHGLLPSPASVSSPVR